MQFCVPDSLCNDAIPSLVKYGSLDKNVIDVMLTNPKPHTFVGQLDRQGAIVVPEIRICAVDHYAGRLEGLGISGFVVGQGAINAVVDAAGVEIGFQLRVDRLRMALVKPCV